MLMSVVIRVVNETRSGSVLNCNANIVVLAAVGIAAKIIATCLTVSLTGKKYKIPTAKRGDIIIRITETAATYR